MRTPITLAVALIFLGCSNSSTPTKPSQQSPDQNGVTFDSPESLVAHAKTLLDESSPRVAEFFDLVEWETPEHQTWRRYVEAMVLPNAETNHASMATFGQELQTTVPFERIQIVDEPITISGDGRAEAVFRDGDSPDMVLYLVKVQFGWRVSAFTIEYNSDQVRDRFRDVPFENWNDMFDLASDLQPVHANYAERIRAGEFESIDAARDAFRKALQQTIRSRSS